MTTITLDQLVETGVKQAQHVLLTQHKPGLQASYTLITDKNEIILLPCTYANSDEKTMMVAVVSATAKISNAIMALFVSEGWMVVLKPQLTPWHTKQQNLPPPSESPDRVEVVQVIATDGTTVKGRRLQMLRDKPGGKLIALVPMAEFDHMETTGPMIDGIIPPRKEKTYE